MSKNQTKDAQNLENDIEQYIKYSIGNRYEEMFKIIMLYNELSATNKFILDLQLFHADEYRKDFEARIWLTSDDYDGLKNFEVSNR